MSTNVEVQAEWDASTVPMQDASLDIWSQKYRLVDKDGNAIDTDIQATYERVANALANIEYMQLDPKLPQKRRQQTRDKHYDSFLWALRNGAIPAGRIMSNAGALEHKPATSTINCTVSGRIGDSMTDILYKNTEAGLTLKAGCGIGYEFSTLRPRGAYVSGAGAYTSGPVSFMDIFDKMCFTVSSAGGRRGAQMGTFDVHHPDVVEFIRAKREDGRLRQFNLSLLITDDFIRAVREESDWHLSFPVNVKEMSGTPFHGVDQQGRPVFIDPNDNAVKYVLRPIVDVPENTLQAKDLELCEGSGATLAASIEGIEDWVLCKVYKTMPARRLWDLIMSSTYDFAEPGFILIDKVNQMNNNWFSENIRATNPCVTPDTEILTRDGYVPIVELVGQEVEVWNGFEWSVVTPKVTGENQSIMKVLTNDGFELDCTYYHKFVLADGTRVEAKDLRPGMELEMGELPVIEGGSESLSNAYAQGFFSGDGWFKGEDKAYIGLYGDDKKALQEHLAPEAVISVNEYSIAGGFEGTDLDETKTYLYYGRGMFESKTYVPSARVSIKDRLDWFAGLCDSDGCTDSFWCKDGETRSMAIQVSSKDREFLLNVKRMLQTLGVHSHLGPMKDCWRLSVTNVWVGKLLELGFKTHRLAFDKHAIKNSVAPKHRVVTTLVYNERVESKVYCFNEPLRHMGTFGGILTANCGEQPLPPYGSCLLGSINLTKFVLDPFTPNARFDWGKFTQIVEIFTRMLDNIVEINGLALEQQRNEIHEKRRHGMGYLGLGSTVSMLGMVYGDEESVEFTSEVSKILALTGFRTGVKLAKEKGCAPHLRKDTYYKDVNWSNNPAAKAKFDAVVGSDPDTLICNRMLFLESEYMQRLGAVDAKLIDDIREWGCRFTHHSSIAPTGTISLSLGNNASNGIEPSFAHLYSRNIIRPGKKTKEKVDVCSFELLAYRSITGNQSAQPEDLPKNCVSADSIDPEAHVRIQAASQYWVDSSISKTINVPTDIPYDAFKDIYLYAHEMGLKGCTTFRFNPEAFQGVLVREDDLANTTYVFSLEDGSTVEYKGNETVVYDGEEHTAANLYDALKEGYYGKF